MTYINEFADNITFKRNYDVHSTWLCEFHLFHLMSCRLCYYFIRCTQYNEKFAQLGAIRSTCFLISDKISLITAMSGIKIKYKKTKLSFIKFSNSIAINNNLADLFYDHAKEMMKHGSKSRIVGLRRFKSFFGASPQICAICWTLIKNELPANYREVHLLWALLFLKCYNTESVNHAIAGCDEKTFREKVWIIVEKLAFMKVVCGDVIIVEKLFKCREIVFKVIWENRKADANRGQTCFTSIDGVDCEIEEPSPFSPKWFSHKFKSAGLRYEIALCIRTGHIVWSNGGYPCGHWPDLNIAKRFFVHFLDRGERSVADEGYKDNKYFLLPTIENSRRHKRIMSRHETINKRIKHFNVLTVPFRHDLSKHRICFYSVSNITQLIIKYEEPLFSAA